MVCVCVFVFALCVYDTYDDIYLYWIDIYCIYYLFIYIYVICMTCIYDIFIYTYIYDIYMTYIFIYDIDIYI